MGIWKARHSAFRLDRESPSQGKAGMDVPTIPLLYTAGGMLGRKLQIHFVFLSNKS